MPLAYSVRLWLSISVALFISFYLELQNPVWSGLAAAIVSLPNVGSTLRKSQFRITGTFIGAAMTLVLAAAFPQDRLLFIGGLALWYSLAAFMTSILRNFASYAAALSGYTVAIIGADSLVVQNAIVPDVMFEPVTARTCEVLVGIVTAGVIRLLTDTCQKSKAQ